jgi:hypothetical protein
VVLGELSTTALAGMGGSGRLADTGQAARAASGLPAGPGSFLDFLPGYQFVECAGRSPGGEVWKVRGPDGRPRLLRFVTCREDGLGPCGPTALPRLRALRHPGLAVQEVLPAGPDRLALLSDPGDHSLLARAKECQARGKPGIPRDELFRHLGEAADALDALWVGHKLRHLGLTPRHLAVRDGRLTLLDFGLVELFWLPAGLDPATLNPRYAALELFEGRPGETSDQYSLALIYQELLVGVHPFRNLNARQLASPRLRGEPDLALLPASDRPVVLRALHPEAGQRYPSCGEFLSALEDVDHNARRVSGVHPGLGRPVAVLPAQAGVLLPKPDWRGAVHELVTLAGRNHQLLGSGDLYYQLLAGQRIGQRGWARLLPGTVPLKLDGFRQQWEAKSLLETESWFVYQVPTATNLWRRCLGRVPALQVEVRLGSPEASPNGLTPVTITIRPVACGRRKAEEMLEGFGPALLRSLRHYLHTHSERHAQERFPWPQAVEVCPAEGAGQTVTGQARDIARDGMALRLPSPPPGPEVTLRLPHPQQTVAVPARVLAVELRPGGTYEVEVRFQEK